MTKLCRVARCRRVSGQDSPFPGWKQLGRCSRGFTPTRKHRTRQPKPQHPSGAAYHGLASLALAAALLLLAVPTLQLAYWLQLSDYKGFDDSGKRLVAYGGYLAAFFAIVLCLTSVVTGARGLGAADRTGESNILCDAGIYLGLFATLVWLGCGFAWHSQPWRFIK